MKHERGRTTLNPWSKGINNRASVRNLPDETVRNAVNADFGAEAQIRCRKGLLKVLDAVNPRGGFSCPLGNFFVEDTYVKKFNADNTSSIVYSWITGDEFAFDYLNDILYFSDGTICMKLDATSSNKWGIGTPGDLELAPTTGTYAHGVYLSLCCWVDVNGVESGPSAMSHIVVPDGSGIVFTGLPTTTDPQVAYLRLYLSMPDGKELYRVADVAVGTASYTITAGRYDLGNVFDGHFVIMPPPGRIIRHYAGCMYVADVNGNVWYSKDLEMDHFKRDRVFSFPAAVDIMQPVKGGIFFAYGNKTVFYEGTPEDGFNIIDLFEYGGVYGTERDIPNTDNVCWQSQRGTIVGTPNGKCKNLQEENVAVESALSGSLLLKEEDGIRYMIASLKQPVDSPLAAKSWIDAEIIRRGA